MPLTLVIMTHSSFPGVEKPASLTAYRTIWYFRGWRSDDDPEYHGEGTAAPTPHVGDNTLHGGGTEIDYAEITADTSALAVTGLSMAAVPGLTVTVPALLRPVYLVGCVHMRHSVASATSDAVFAPVGSSSIAAARGPSYVTHRATGDPVTAVPFYRIPPATAGEWQVFVSATTGGNVTVVASAVAQSSIRAVTA